MTRATKISRVVFGLLVLATFFAFFAAQRLKHSDPLVYSISFKRYISPNDDGLREKGRVRFRTKKADHVTVTVIDRTNAPVRVLADDEKMKAGPHTFYWNGRFRGTVDADGKKHRGEPVPDGAYRVRVTMRASGRSFVPDQFFVVDTEPPTLFAAVEGTHTISVLRGRRPVPVRFGGSGSSLRAEFRVYRVRGQRAVGPAVATFLSRRGTSLGEWDQSIGAHTSWATQCQGVERRGRAHPAPTGSYAIVARACDGAGNVGSSSTALPPRVGSSNGLSGVTLTGVQIAPATRAAVVGTRASFRVAPPVGGYRWDIRRLSGERVSGGRARGATLRITVPRTDNGLYLLVVRAKRAVRGDRGFARTPLPIASRNKARLLIVQPAIAWQAGNPVDMTGDGFGDPFELLPPGRQLSVPLDRLLARPGGPPAFAAEDGAVAGYLQSAHPELKAQTTTDLQLAAAPAAALRGYDGVIFTGDERWITAELGTAMRGFVEAGGKVAFFSSDAFRRTVRLAGTELSGPSERRARDIFGESITRVTEPPAPLVPFVDQLGLMRGPTGLFTTFEQSKQLARGAKPLTTAGRDPKAPALMAYSLGKGQVIRVGVPGWSALLGGATPANVAYTTDAIVEVLTR